VVEEGKVAVAGPDGKAPDAIVKERKAPGNGSRRSRTAS